MMRLMITAAMMSWSMVTAIGVCAADQAADEAAIRKAVESYVAAFNNKDAKALAAMWLPDAVYTDPESGAQVVGREAIEEQFAAVLGGEEPIKLASTTDSVQFVSPSVAVEHGKATVIRGDQELEETQYTAVYVRRDGAWLLDRVTEEAVPEIRSNYDKLKDLEWMIGTWVDADESARIETKCSWTKNRNFITRMFSLSVRDRIEVSGMQIVGWDAAGQRIRSWVFDSDGGFGEGVWKKKGAAWHIQTTGVAPDGSKSSSTNIITAVDENTFTWQSINRAAGGELLPNVDEVVVARQAD